MLVTKYCTFVVDFDDDNELEFVFKFLTHSECAKNFYYELFRNDNHLHILVSCDSILDLSDIHKLEDIICSFGLFVHSVLFFSDYNYDKVRTYLSSHSD